MIGANTYGLGGDGLAGINFAIGAPVVAAFMQVLADNGVDRNIITAPSNSNDPFAVVRGFYAALAQGRGDWAVRFIVPEKRETGNYKTEGMSNFWGNVDVPIQVTRRDAHSGRERDSGCVFL